MILKQTNLPLCFPCWMKKKRDQSLQLYSRSPFSVFNHLIGALYVTKREVIKTRYPMDFAKRFGCPL